MKRLTALAAVAVLSFALTACGEKQDQLGPGKSQSMTVMLDWVPNADHVGLYQALADGNFAKAGLDVHVETPPNPASPLQLLAAGKVDIAISYEPQVLLARNQGEALVSVGAIVQRPLTSIVSIGQATHHLGQAAPRQDRRLRRDPVPAGVPGHDPDAGGRPRSARSSS